MRLLPLRLIVLLALMGAIANPSHAQGDPRQAEQWHLERIEAPEGWTYPVTLPATVAVLDTGIDYTHPDLAAHIWQNLAEDADGDGRTLEFLDGRWQLDPGDLNGIDDDDFDGDPTTFVDDLIGWDFIDDDNDPMDEHGHGTHVAGLIGAVGGNGVGGAGVARAVRLMGLRIGSSLNAISVQQAVRAADYARMHDVRVINSSWGSFNHSANLESAAQRARDADILWVAASGFSTIPGYTMPFYPAAFRMDNILSVGSASRADGQMDNSNYDPGWVDLVAPAEDLLSTTLGGGYATSSGTSMAAAVTSGAAAQVLAVAPTLNYGELRNLLEASTVSLDAFAGFVATSGRLHLGRAFELLLVGLRTSPEWFIFSGQFIGTPITEYRPVTNFGLEPVTIELSANDPAFTVEPEIIELNPGDQDTYAITFTPSARQWYRGQLTMQAGSWEQVIQLRGEGVQRPEAQVTTKMLNPTLTVETHALARTAATVATLTLKNSGDIPLRWSATIEADSAVSATASVAALALLNVESSEIAPDKSQSTSLLVDPGALPAGTYTVWVVFATNGIPSEVRVPVTFEVDRPGYPALADGDAAWGDYDLDGDMDLVMTGLEAGLPRSVLFRNDGTGQMVLQVDAMLPTVAGDVAWGESTGRRGLYLALADTSTVMVVGLHASNDTTSTRWPALGHDVDWADYDGDGDLDLVGTTGVLVRTDPPGQTLRPQFEHRALDDLMAPTPRPQAPLDHAAWADYDRDGDLDVLATGADGIWLITQEPNTLRAVRLHTDNHSAGHPAWTYANDDLLLDAVVVVDGHVLRWHQGAGEWTASTMELPGLSAAPRAVQWADVDADLRLDLLILTDDRLHIYDVEGFLLEGQQGVESRQVPVPAKGALALGRLGNDRIIDLAITGQWPNTGTHMPIYQWDHSPTNTPPFPPTELLATADGQQVTLTWGNGWDRPATSGRVSERLVTYDLFLAHEDGTPVVQAEGDINSSARWVMRPGKFGTRQQWSGELPVGRYQWTVRSVDGSLAMSRPMPMRLFEVKDDASDPDDPPDSDDPDDQSDPDDPDIKDPEDPKGPSAVTAFALHAAYPQPFTTTTRIPFDLPTPSLVRLTVTDLLGRSVATLFDGSLAEGKYEVEWHANQAPPGLYLIRLETPTWHQTRTAVVVR